MKDLKSYILEKKSINFGSSKSNYGQCIILAGGPGSGKGYIKDHKVLANFKSVDIDEMKKMYIKMQEKGLIDDDYNYNLKRAEDTFKLHFKVKERGWKGKQRGLFWGQRNTEVDSNLLPNILWDMVSGDPEDVLEIIKYAKPCGYKITLIWVCCNIETAKQGNKNRDRIVPDDVLEKGHKEAYKCITDIFSNKYPIITEGIDNAWIALTPGYKRILTDKFKSNEIIKVEKNKSGEFVFNQSYIDDFLKEQMPLNSNWDKEQEKENDRKRKLEPSKLKESLEETFIRKDLETLLYKIQNEILS